MPIIYLSPSTQEWNMYVTGSGSEEYNMNRLADALVPYLRSNGIQYTAQPAGDDRRQLHPGGQPGVSTTCIWPSTPTPPRRAAMGRNRGIIAFYYPGSVNGRRAAELLGQKSCGRSTPCPTRSPPGPPPLWVRCASPGSPRCCWRSDTTTTTQTPPGWRATGTPSPSRSPGRLTEYFGLPFIYPMDPVEGTVAVSNGTLNLRDYPSSTGKVIANLPNGAKVTVYGEWNGAGMWCDYNGHDGLRRGGLHRHMRRRASAPAFRQTSGETTAGRPPAAGILPSTITDLP